MDKGDCAFIPAYNFFQVMARNDRMPLAAAVATYQNPNPGQMATIVTFEF